MFFRRPPDFVIGNDYLRRWWVIPRNRFFNIYLHNIRHSDDDRALHDHPWWNLTIILKGGYLEVLPTGRKARRAGSIILRRATALHRLEVRDQQEAWTLFLTGPVIRDWGFACPQGWIPWRQFVDPDNTGQQGRGCGEA
jgi:hypothetical protein